MKITTKISSSPFGGARPTVKKTVAAVKPKKAKKPVVEDADEDDLDEDVPATPRKARELALIQAPSLGIPDFEVTPEEFHPEGLDDENRQDNIRKNDEQLLAPTRLPSGSNARVRGIVTMFGQRSDTILKLLETDEETDGALTLIHRTLLQTLVDVLPVVERGVRRSKGRRGVIPMNQLVSQIRELVADVQSIRDKGQMGAALVDRVVRPAYLDLASQISLGFLEMENSARARMSEPDFKAYRDDVLMVVKRNLAQYLQGQYESIRNDVVSSLS